MRHTSTLISSLSLAPFLLLAVTGCGDDGTTPPADSGVTADGGDAATDAEVDGGGAECTGRPTESPEPRGEVEGIYDETNNRLVVFGGNTSAPVMCMPVYTQTNEIWAFELDCNNWQRLDSAGGPGSRSRTAIAVDTMRDRMLVFGGMDGDPFSGATRFNEVWALDLTTDTWTEVTTTGPAPTPKGYAVAAYDAAKDRLLVHGGDPGGFNGIDEMHALDLATNTWTEISGGTTPSARLYHGVTWVGTEMVIFAGAGGFGADTYSNDIWAFDATTDTWREVRAGGSDAPLTRFGADIFTDASGNMVAFGGHDATDLGNSNDVMAYDFGGDAWSSIRPGDTLNGLPLGRCDFPNDFTLPEEGVATPERRHSGVAAQSATKAFITMGKTDCGVINDVWSFDLAAGTWELLRPPTGGEACNRSGATTCTTLCN